MTSRFVAYLRVSTVRQGQSGLGLEAQREAVAAYVRSVGGEVAAEYLEIESGRRSDRPELLKSIATCRRTGGKLVIAKLDRLARSVAFISALMETGVDFVAADAPFADRLMLHIMAAFAEHERAQISARTKAALAAAKARGVQLGKHGAVLAQRNRATAAEFAAALSPTVQHLREQGCLTLRDFAEGLNQLNVPSREGGRWHPTSVGRLLDRIAGPEPAA